MGIWLLERRGKFKWSLLCSSKELLLLLKVNSIYVADCDSVVLC